MGCPAQGASRGLAQGPEQTLCSIASITVHIPASTLLNRTQQLQETKYEPCKTSLCWRLTATQKQFLGQIIIDLPLCIDSRIDPIQTPNTRNRKSSSCQPLPVTARVMGTTFLNIWHVQNDWHLPRQKHTQYPHSREASSSPAEHSSFRDLTSTEQLEGKTVPMFGLAKRSLKWLLLSVSTDLLKSHLKTLTLQAQLSASDQPSPRGREAACYTRGDSLEQGVHRTKSSCFQSLATQTEVLKATQEPQRDSVLVILPVFKI